MDEKPVEMEKSSSETLIKTEAKAKSTPDPAQVSRNLDVIKSAQKEFSQLDILVCGKCQQVFHFIEDFREHQSGAKCTPHANTTEQCKGEQMPQLWAFVLWRNAHQLHDDTDAETEAWTHYQRWCKLDNVEKESWIAAGRTLKAHSSITVARIHEMKCLKAAGHKTPVPKEDSDRPARRVGRPGRPPKNRIDIKAIATTDQDIEEALERIHKGTHIVRKPPIKPPEPEEPAPILPFNKRPASERRAQRTIENGQTEEGIVEKITKKRMHPKNKTVEYFVKWENLDESRNSWELSKNFETCKALIDDFERILARQRNAKALALKNAALITPEGRPQRSSKQKALNQVKEWCGDISDDEMAGKRGYSDDEDSSDSFEKKIKHEEETESSEDEKKIKRIVKPPPPIESKILPTPQKVVRVNQKQMPNLSSGVYLMSKTEGIIKLDANTAIDKNTLLKVGSKIGQTQIKVIKKEDGTTSRIIKIPQKFGKATLKASITKIERDPLKITPKGEDESDDGLEEMEFPQDLPVPEPDSPPGEFTLCPLTGKVLGQDYPEKMDTTPTEDPETSTSLDVLVKQAVSDLTDADINLGAKSDAKPATKIEQQSVAVSSTNVAETGPKATPTTTTAVAAAAAVVNNNIANGISITPVVATPTKKLLSTPAVIRHKVATERPAIPKPTTTIIHKLSASRTPNTINKRAAPATKPLSFEPVLKRTANVATYKGGSITRRLEGYRSPAKPALKPLMASSTIKVAHEPKETTTAAAAPMNMPLLSAVAAAGGGDTAVQAETVTVTAAEADISTLAALGGGGDAPMLITGEDGTIYQVAGQNEEGQTVLISQGPDGQQQCVLVASDTPLEESGAEEQAAAATVVAAGTTTAMEEEEENVGEGLMGAVSETEDGQADGESQVVAQIVKADPPSPGGTRKVVLMLPDGNLMMTDVTAEQYAALELDK